MTSVFIPEVPLGSVVAMTSDTVEVLVTNRVYFFLKCVFFSQENELEQLSPGHRLESGEVVEFARRVSFFPVGADDFHLKWNQIWEIEFCAKK